MATQLFLTNSRPGVQLGTNHLTLVGAAADWNPRALSSIRGFATQASLATATVAGATNGVEVLGDAGTAKAEFISAPLTADVTIAGTITLNIWASESAAQANVAINAVIDVIRANATGTANSNTIVQIAKSARTTEVATPTRAVNNFTVTPTSTVVNKGDRLRLRIFADDAGTMGSGRTFDASWGSTTASVDGDSYVTFTETFSLDTGTPSGTQLFLTDSASPVATASVDREAWTSRDVATVSDDVNTAAGYTAPLQLTDTAGGTAADWFTRPLAAFTLSGLAEVRIRASVSVAASNVCIRCEIARVDNDGTNPTVWSTWCSDPTTVLSTTDAAIKCVLSGDDLAISDGQRLRFRVYIDDAVGAMVASRTVTVTYGRPSGAGSGDSWVTLTQTVTEFSSAPGPSQSYRFLRANRFLTSR